MASTVFALTLFALLVAVGVAFWWQERRTAWNREVVYGVEEALDFVMARLSDDAKAQVNRRDVRRILEWELRYLQDPALRGDDEAVVGGLEAAQYAQERALQQGHAYDGAVIIEILDHQAAYLAELGAIDRAADDDETRRIIERYEQQG